jgi:hypothetical protein
MKRDCDACGRQYFAKSKRSKFCTDVECKRRRERERKRRGGGEVVEMPGASSAPERASEGSIAAAARAELVAAGRADTSVGRAAIALAERLELGMFDTGSSMAALSREYRATLAEALKDARVDADTVDELGERRRRRHA